MLKVKYLFITLIILTVSLTATGCSDDKGDGADYAFNCSLLGNPDNLDPQMATNPSSFTIIKNMYSGLLKLDSAGTLCNDIADKYSVSDDGLTYTFDLKKSIYWYSKDFEDEDEYTVTANDFVFAFRRLFNPQTQSPYRNDFRCIKNADAIINGTLDCSEIGVSSENNYQLVIQLDYPDADFLTLLTTPAALPCNESFFNETKGRYGLDKDSVISNGSFYITEWFYDKYGSENILIMKRNSFNSETDKVYPSTLSFKIDKSYDAQLANFKSKAADYLYTNSDCSKFSSDDYIINECQDSTLGLIFNLSDSIYSNINIRRAFTLSLDRSDIQKQVKDKEVSAAYAIVPPAATLLNKKYRELVPEENISVFDEKKAVSSLETGMNELGINSMETVKILVRDNMFNQDYMHFLTQKWQELFGFYIGFDSFPEDEYNQKIAAGDYKIAVYEMSGSYNSVFSVLNKFRSGNNAFGYSNPQTDSILSEAQSKINLNQCIDLFRSAEKQIVDDCAFVPVFYNKKYLIYRKTNADIIYQPFSGQIDFKYAKYYED